MRRPVTYLSPLPRLAVAFAALATAMAPLVATAQDAAPVIQIPAPGSDSILPQVPSPQGGTANQAAADQTAAPQDGGTTDTAKIEIPMGGTGTADGAGQTETVIAQPIIRDGNTGADQAAADAAPQDWLMPLVPARLPVPTEVSVGPSMPRPGILRLTGEEAKTAFVLDIPAGAPIPDELVLSVQSSVNDLPETSRMRVSVNDAPPMDFTLDSFGKFSKLTMPGDALNTGRNRITVDVAQSHRIYCGPDATFAIWTEIDLGHSGGTMPADKVPVDAQGFVAALQAQTAGGGTLAVLGGDVTPPELMRKIADAATGALGRYPEIEPRQFYTLDTDAQRARIAAIPAETPGVSFRRGGDGAIVMVLEYTDSATPDISEQLPSAEPVDTVRALTPGVPTRFETLGYPVIVGNTHYFKSDVDFNLPEDWLLLANQKADLSFVYGFAAQLPKGSILLVKANGETVQMLPLDENGGKILDPLDIRFDASLLSPGKNSISVEMMVPGDPADLPCGPRDSDYLAVLGSSTLNVPPSPSMRYADMSRSLSRLSGADVSLAGSSSLRDDNAILPFAATFQPLVDDGKPAQLRIVALDDVGVIPTGNTGVSRKALQDIVYPNLASEPVLMPTPKPAQAEPAPAPATPSYSGFNLGSPAAQTAVAETPASIGLGTRLEHLVSADGWAMRQVHGLRDLAFPGDKDLTGWLKGKSGKAALMQLDPSDAETVWLVTAPDADMAQVAAAIDRFRRGAAGKAHGQMAVLQDDGSWAIWSSQPQPELLERFTPDNLRAILGNYASWSPLFFTVLAIVLALLSALPALLFVVLTRPKGSKQ